jgi:hypothetical protein
MHVTYLRDFVASGRDPHTLPRLWIEATSDAPESLAVAARAAEVVFVGVVSKTTFDSGPDGLPVAHSTVRVTDVLKGSPAGEVQVQQAGGPVPQPNGTGGLAQLTTDELILPGDQVVILGSFRSDLGAYQTSPTAGVYFVREGRVYPEESNRFGHPLRGQPLAVFSAALRLQAR